MTRRATSGIIAFSMLFRGLMMVLTAIFRGFGDSRTPMIINIGINLLNVVGNYLLIYPTHDVTLFGHTFTVWGAGWGGCRRGALHLRFPDSGSLVLLFMCFTPRSGPMRISIHESFRPSKETIQEVFRVSLPVMFERFTTSGAFVITSSIIASLGTISLAANSLAGQAESLSFMPGFAFGTAVTTLVGQSLGADNVPLARKYVRLSGIIGSVVMFIMSIFLFIFSDGIISIFTPDAAVIELGGQLLRILALIQVPQMLAMVFSGALRGAGDTKSRSSSPFFRCGACASWAPSSLSACWARTCRGSAPRCAPTTWSALSSSSPATCRANGPSPTRRTSVSQRKKPSANNFCQLPRDRAAALSRFFHGRGCKTRCPSRQICLFSRLKSPLICAILLL